MKKTVKKLDANVIKALTLSCEYLKGLTPEFLWLTHTADYSNFPASLQIRCVFTTDAASEGYLSVFAKRIHADLLKAGVLLKAPKHHIVFDSEQACLRDHEGNWKKRLASSH
ncbi:Fis family transcriptional regulator [Glaciecola siphonariae]|uniref:Fis family transcriptional regulator n=1 Tax=Glaciecola siphonariae TaxID=521012 RepID=A0ABV9LXD2_9ALTE